MAIVRFPEESIGIKFQSFDSKKFKKDQEFDDETFGWYDGVYVAVSFK